ncbi:MAG: PQQ-dependent methanol/ethanol family dehydrogenase [Hyphomicrobium sp.]|nr:PQQ-dependent methanol/ethanol family dehydrogenase [Hyphomicrobium sp.]
MFATASAIALSVGFGTSAFADVSIDDVVNDAASTNDVLTSGLGGQAQRYSPLDLVNKDNVSSLVPAWAMSLGGEKMRGQQGQPLVKDGVMYVTGSYSRAWAIDVKTGKEIWQYDHRLPEGILPCCDVINRGGALIGDKFIFGTLDAKLVALDAKSGKVVWSKEIDDYKAGYSYTAAPLIVPSKAHGPLLVTGVSGGEFGVIGRVEARKVDNGDLVWSRPTIEGHMGKLNGKDSTMTGKKNESWPGDLWKTGGGATWLGGTFDPETGLVFFGTGNPAPWNSHMRPGDNKWSCSRIAIDPENGEIKWGFQTTPNDGWDFDGVNEVVSFDLDGTKAVATADRNGFFYVLNRENGKFIRGFPFVEKISWAKGLDDNGRPIFVPENRPGNPKDSKDGKKGESIFAVPSFLGGKNQMPMAYSPKTKLFYVPANEWGMDLHNEPVTYKKGAAYLGAGFTIKPVFDDHIGALKAVDPASGKIAWQVNNKAPLWGGVLTTGGGLVIYGTPEGDLKVLDDASGKELWSFNTGSGIVAPPVTWEQDGEQMITVMSGWGGAVPLWGGEVAKTVSNLNQGGMVWTFKLPKKLAAN